MLWHFSDIAKIEVAEKCKSNDTYNFVDEYHRSPPGELHTAIVQEWLNFLGYLSFAQHQALLVELSFATSFTEVVLQQTRNGYLTVRPACFFTCR